ncbi:unnamed protein product [Trichobilharzia regenti]|nr:unnamed protein product [Trichobilharzia regenti]
MPKRVKSEICASEETECKRRNNLFRLIGSDISVLKSLYIIILRSSRELAASFPTLARDLAEGFLEDSRLSLCLNLMWKSQSAELLKVSLQLLATVVTVSEDLARGLVAENRSVSKTQRARVFNRHCLQRLVSLYFWRGEGKNVNEVLKKGDVDVNENEVSSVRCAVHKLLLHLFTSSRLGVVFSAKFDSDIQYNGLILQCLTCAQMDGAYMDPLRTELVVKALCKCPDVFVPYLDHLAPTLYPRDSSGWFSVMDFVLQLYQSVGKYILQFIVNALSYSLTVDVMASAIANFCVLSPKMVDPISQAVKVGVSFFKFPELSFK